jgi:rRNA-processing protein FCF1
MNAIDLELHNAALPIISITEKYIGYIEWNWFFSKIYYTADCTLSYPFDLFDKTITGILLLEPILSIEKIGEILGFNLIHNPECRQYRDQAEYDILRAALDNLVSFGMITIGDNNYSCCQLTPLGKTYAEKGKKFKTEQNKTFYLFYDHLTNNHLKAKENLQHFTGEVLPYLWKDCNFLDQNLMKQIAQVQFPQVYDIQKGHFFENPKIDESHSFSYSLKIYISFFFNIQTLDYYIRAYEPRSKSYIAALEPWLNLEIRQELLNKFFLTLPKPKVAQLNFPPSYSKALQEKFVEWEIALKDCPESAPAIAKLAYTSLGWVELEYFWNHLEEFCAEDTQEAWFLFSDTHPVLLQKIIDFAKSRPSTIFIILLLKTLTAVPAAALQNLQNLSQDPESNIILLQTNKIKITNFLFLNITQGSIYFELSSKLLNLLTTPIQTHYLERSQRLPLESYKELKHIVATHFLPNFKTSFEEFTLYQLDNSSLTKEKLKRWEKLNQKSAIFFDLLEVDDIQTMLYSIEQTYSIFWVQIKNKHQNLLLEEVHRILCHFEKKEFKSLEDIKPYKEAIDFIKNECLEEYQILIQSLNILDKKIYEEEKYLKENILSKTYIIDTNIFIEEPDIISKIGHKHSIALSIGILEELDKHKTNEVLKERAAKAIKNIHTELKKAKNLYTPSAKRQRIKITKPNMKILPEVLQKKRSIDNYLLSVALVHQKDNPFIITLDKNLQSKAMMLDIPTLSLDEFLFSQAAETDKIENN